MKDVPERSSLWSRLGWFAMLYLGGVLAVLMLAAALHMLLSAQLQKPGETHEARAEPDQK
ncbi:MAG TPA: hypothetical protein VGY49_02995 [Burkholderiaceae bacterium]|jgi:hypothetical protein|nr:hypothetical protein [Burkholderiaceae bacterium]